MNKPMDKQALCLITMMNHHLTHDYASEENKQRNLDVHLKEFKYFASLPSINIAIEDAVLFVEKSLTEGDA